METITIFSFLVNVSLFIAKLVVYVLTHSVLILTDSFDSLLNATILCVNHFFPKWAPLVNYAAMGSYRSAYILVSIAALVDQTPLQHAEVLLIAACSFLAGGILLMFAQLLTAEYDNKKMIIIATINDNSSTLGAIISSSIGYSTGEYVKAGVVDNSLNIAVCLFFAILSVFNVYKILLNLKEERDE